MTYTFDDGIKHLQTLDQKGVGLERGRSSIQVSDLAYEVLFDRYDSLAGFVGYEDTEVKSLGFYRYKCATRPDDVTGTPVTDEDGNEIGTGDGSGETTDNGGSSTNRNNG